MKTIILTLGILSNILFISGQTIIYEQYVSNNNVFTLAMDGDILWLGTDGGIVKFNKKTEEYTHYTEISDTSIRGYYKNRIISVAVNNNGELYTTGDGVIHYNGTDWYRYTSQNSNLPMHLRPHHVAIDNYNTLWVGAGEYMCSLENDVWTNFQLLDAPWLSHFDVNECDFDSENDVWAGTSEGLFKIENDSVENIDVFDFGPINSVKIKNDTVITGTTRNGLVLYNPADSSIIEYNTSNSSIPSNSVSYVYPVEDSSWVVAGSKLLVFGDGQFTAYMDKDSVIKDLLLNRVLPDGNVLWLGTARNGLCKYNLNTNTCEIKTINNNLLNNGFNTFCVDSLGCMYFTDTTNPGSLKIKDNESWLVKTKNDLDYFNQTFNIVYDSDTLKVYEKNNVVISFFEEDSIGINNNNPQIGGSVKTGKNNSFYQTYWNGGFLEYKEDWTNFTNGNSIIPTQYVSNLCFDNSGKLWFSANTYLDTVSHEIVPGGLVSYIGNEFEVISLTDIPGVDNESTISCMYFDSTGVLWLGISELSTEGIDNGYGLFKYDGNTWVNYTIENSGLSSNTIRCINSFGNDLYIGTYAGGVSVLNRSEEIWETYDAGNSVLFGNTIKSINFDNEGGMYTHIESIGILKTNKEVEFSQTSIETGSFEDKITVFPNPAKDWITIKIMDVSPTHIKKICIYDISGKLLVSKNMSTINNNKTRINLKEILIKDGMYFIEIITGKRSYINKIVFYN